MTHLDDLKEAVANNAAVVVLGTGFSSAVAADGTSASWIGLLRSGITYLRENGLASDAILDSIDNDIFLGATESGSFLLTAGQKISDQMQRANSVHFASFLDSTVGALRIDPQKTRLAEVIEKLDLPVLTTNYDDLYEQGAGKPSTTWREPRKFRSSVLGKSTEVVHLHGVWNDPDTVILTSRDYERIIRDRDTIALREAIGVLKSIIFVGYGAGLTDPHFEQLWQWLSPLLPQGIKHYVLCRDEDVAEINTANMGRPIVAVSYGADYSDLPPFIESIVPPRNASSNTMEDPRTLSRVAETCRLQIIDQIVATSVMPWVIENRDQDFGLDDLVIEPVMFPVPPEQFIAERAAGNKDLKPLEPTAEVNNGDALLIVGEEQAGVSTALAWAAMVRATKDPAAIPVMLDYKQIGQGNHRVQNAIRLYLRRAGAPINKKQPLPANLVVAIDNMTAANERDLTHTVQDLVNNLDTKLVLLGCRPSAESWIQSRFTDAGASILTAYLGRLSRHKTIELARRADPEHAERLADRVLKIARKEGLTRTPLCLMLLIVGTVNDDAWVNAVSHTTFLDSFIDSLLGRGSFQDDMHLSIDSTGYSMVLESFAKKLIDEDSASASWAETIVFIDDIVQRLDWSDNSIDILNRLMVKGLLVNRDGQVQFRQHVYLHIFAARRCRSDDDLVEKLKQRPLYYASTIRHYAALQRDDIDLLRWAVEYAAELESTLPSADGVYRRLEAAELEVPIKALERPKKEKANEASGDVAHASDAGHDSETAANDVQAATAIAASDDGATSAAAVAPDSDDDFDPFDVLEPKKRSPFPAHDLDSAPFDVSLIQKLTLVSNILRDSELVQDAGLKEQALGRALRGWGLLMGVLYESDQIKDLVERVFDAMSKATDLSESQKAVFLPRFMELWSVVMASAAIAEELATIKLERAVTRILTSESASESVHLLLPAMMLTLQANDSRLNPVVRELLLKHHDNAAVRAFVEFVLRLEYFAAKGGSRKAEELEEFITDFWLVTVDDPGKRARNKPLLVARLRTLKMGADLPNELTTEADDGDEIAS